MATSTRRLCQDPILRSFTSLVRVQLLASSSPTQLSSCPLLLVSAAPLRSCAPVTCRSVSSLGIQLGPVILSALRNSPICGKIPIGGGRPDGIIRQCRGYAAKAKKAKSRNEEVSDSLEDVSSAAKEMAVKMMETALHVLSREHAKLRTGRASAGMLDHITVEAHGVRTPLNHIAAVTVSGLQTLTVLPYDASMVKEVEKSILNSPLGLNPQVEGVTLTVPLPRLTKEHCETMCKLAGKAGESAKLTIRRARKEALDAAKGSGSLSKDEVKRFEKEVENLTKKYTTTIDETCKKKEKEIMA